MHCVEWARDRFEKLFTKQPGLLARLLENPSALDDDAQGLKVAVRLLSKAPYTFEDCIAFARRKFQKVCRGDLARLRFVFTMNFSTSSTTACSCSTCIPKMPKPRSDDHLVSSNGHYRIFFRTESRSGRCQSGLRVGSCTIQAMCCIRHSLSARHRCVPRSLASPYRNGHMKRGCRRQCRLLRQVIAFELLMTHLMPFLV